MERRSGREIAPEVIQFVPQFLKRRRESQRRRGFKGARETRTIRRGHDRLLKKWLLLFGRRPWSSGKLELGKIVRRHGGDRQAVVF
jgi:hypothetical protein